MNEKDMESAADVAYMVMADKYKDDKIAEDAELLADLKNDIAMLGTDWGKKVAEIFKIVFQKRIHPSVEILFTVPERKDKKGYTQTGGEMFTIGPMGFGTRSSSYNTRSDYDVQPSDIKRMIEWQTEICNALETRMKHDVAVKLAVFLAIVKTVTMWGRYERHETKAIHTFKIKKAFFPDQSSIYVAHEINFQSDGTFDVQCQGRKSYGTNARSFSLSSDDYEDVVLYGQMRDEFLEALPKMSADAKKQWVPEKQAIEKLNDAFGKELLLSSI